MIKPTFNPAHPYTFNDTEEDRLLGLEALVEWSPITNVFKCFIDANGDKVWWDKKQSYCKSNKDKILVCMSLDGPLSDWPNYKINFPVTYTPPEAIKVIMSGELFELDDGEFFYTKNEEIFSGHTDNIISGLHYFIESNPNWHTAKLVEPEKKKPRVFKDWLDFATNCDALESPTIKITFQNGFTKTIEGYWPKDKHDIYLKAAFDAGATVELVEG